ncbi:sporulation protein YtxC [Peribacillus sp. SCS-155]|uniref:sporulation protein YtxC n=1 Tax=Peribacillus sedimenti TaxID=3115297 RepID=UPI0039062FB3
MLYIHFEKPSEAMKMLQYVSAHPFGRELNEYIVFEDEKGLFVNMKANYTGKLVNLLSDVFYRFLLEHKLLSLMENILRQKFFYREQEEIDTIVEIAYSLIETKMIETRDAIFSKERQILHEGLCSFLLGHISFSFDSFATFRLKSFHESLLVFVENAIDEYKLEQDYQNFIATLRDFLNNTESKMDVIHLLHHNGFHFYDSQFREMGKQVIHKLIDRKLLSENPVYIDSTTIAPLISIAPQTLQIYTDEREDGLIQTVIRIFEERTVVRSVKGFYSAVQTPIGE